ncbi:MAG: ABC transporter substrate-binding protein [Candidatus Peribacteraceae bacterium]|jgi:NitT/TauT family transport system substrate-binding protein
MRRPPVAIIGLGAVVALAGMVAIGFFTPTRGSRTLTLAYPSLISSALIYVAEDRGFFTQEGMEVVLQPHSVGRDAVRSLVEGKADAAVAYETPLLRQACDGKDLVALAQLHTSERNTGLILRGTGADIVSLKGKAVGVPRGTNAEFVLQQLLRFHGLTFRDIIVKDIPLPASLEAWEKGEVQALALWNPILSDAAQAAREQTQTVFSDVYTESSVLMVRSEDSARRRGALERLLHAFKRAERFMGEHPEEGRAIVQRNLKIPPEQLAIFWPHFDFHVTLSNVLMSILENEAAWFRDQGECPFPVQTEMLIDPQLLRSMDPLAVTLESKL